MVIDMNIRLRSARHCLLKKIMPCWRFNPFSIKWFCYLKYFWKA